MLSYLVRSRKNYTHSYVLGMLLHKGRESSSGQILIWRSSHRSMRCYPNIWLNEKFYFVVMLPPLSSVHSVLQFPGWNNNCDHFLFNGIIFGILDSGSSRWMPIVSVRRSLQIRRNNFSLERNKKRRKDWFKRSRGKTIPRGKIQHSVSGCVLMTQYSEAE